MSTEETVYYDEGGIKITSARAVLGGKTYSMSNITSVSATSKPKPIAFPAILVLIGVIIALVSIGNQGIVGWVVAALFILGGVGLYATTNVMHTVRIGSASGEANAYTTNSKPHIDKIVEAINTAIIKRG